MTRFEITYLIVAPLTLVLLVQFIALAWLDKRLPRWVLWTVFGPITIPFALLDVAYNAVIGTLLFRRLPREWFLTTRLKEMGPDARTERFARVLNHFDKGHV